MPPKILKIAVCIFPGVATLDYQGPMELFGFLAPSRLSDERSTTSSPFALEPTYISYTKDPVKPASGPLVLPDRTFDDIPAEEQFEIVLIPGGPGVRPNVIKPPFLEFVKRQVPGATYVLSVCTGSWVLAQAGLLSGKRATTNKSTFSEIKKATADQNIQWVAKARWVVDGNFWTASGITAGTDMASAFLEYLVGAEITKSIRGVAEVSVRQQDDDEFAEMYGLV